MNYFDITNTTKILRVKPRVQRVIIPVLRDDCVMASVDDWVIPFDLDGSLEIIFDQVEIEIDDFDFLGKKIGLGYNQDLDVLVIQGTSG